MGQVFYDMGFLGTTEVVECSASELVGQYVGHTGPKVRETFDKALGRILFIDEAYRLSKGEFAKEAIDEIVDSLTKERYHKRLIVILAGYDNEIDGLLAVNPGLASRFPETVYFKSLTPGDCTTLLYQSLATRKATVVPPTDDEKKLINQRWSRLAALPAWGNARDVKTLSSVIYRSAVLGTTSVEGDGKRPTLSTEAVLREMDSLMADRERQAQRAKSRFHGRPSDTRNKELVLGAQPPPPPPAPIPANSAAAGVPPSQANAKKDAEDGPREQGEGPQHPPADQVTQNTAIDAYDTPTRDAGVSDEVWEQLQRDIAAAAARQAALIRKREAAVEMARRVLEEKERAERAKEESKRLEALRRLEEARIESARRDAERAEMERKANDEIRVREKLRKSGRCPVGYPWIRQEGGYRCAGGSHFVRSIDLA